VRLHYGCGLEEAPGWANFDASPTLWLQRLPLIGPVFRKWMSPLFPASVQYGDIIRGLPVPPASCEAIYCCHVLEHLSLEDLRLALRNTNNYLKTGGIFRLVVPDFEQLVGVYLANPLPTAVSNFLGYTYLGRKTRPKGVVEILKDYFGNSYHLWMWDYKGMESELQAAGFRGIRRCQLGDAKDPAFCALENPARFKWSLAIECTK
jgi:SAM-dependent methyltransferase